jgi:hypothetical protein
LLKVARSTLCYRPVPASPDDLAVMRRMDELHLPSPLYGSRRMTAVLRRESWLVNRKRGSEIDAGPHQRRDTRESSRRLVKRHSNILVLAMITRNDPKELAFTSIGPCRRLNHAGFLGRCPLRTNLTDGFG